jgi:hypothetical protein
MKSFAFTWNTEPRTKTLHAAGLTTIVSLHFSELDSHRTRVDFTDVGWGEGTEWDESYQAFDRDWDVVLGRLKIRFVTGPVNWTNPPQPVESLSVR